MQLTSTMRRARNLRATDDAPWRATHQANNSANISYEDYLYSSASNKTKRSVAFQVAALLSSFGCVGKCTNDKCGMARQARTALSFAAELMELDNTHPQRSISREIHGCSGSYNEA
eukprot:scaffold7692_cov121-Skeletonema_menzelii.AAC.5